VPEDDHTTIVTMELDAADLGALLAVLAKYVVVARGHHGCRNIDLCRSVIADHRVVVISKWSSPSAQQAHFDSAEMVEMATACAGILLRPPRIELWEGISAHDQA